jgi:hypothetical protein
VRKSGGSRKLITRNTRKRSTNMKQRSCGTRHNRLLLHELTQKATRWGHSKQRPRIASFSSQDGRMYDYSEGFVVPEIANNKPNVIVLLVDGNTNRRVSVEI